MATTETIRVVVGTIKFRKGDDGWSILFTDRGTVKGCVPWEPKPGDALKLEGFWKRSTYNGADEFIFKTAMIDVPESKRALLTYAVSLTTGMGDATAEKIWDRYGEEWTGAADLDIKGLTLVARDAWKTTLTRIAEQKEQATAVAFLLDHGCTLNMAAVAWGKWEKSTISVVQADPFQLAELPKYGFKTVDEGIRQTFGIEDMDPRRAVAAIRYLLGENSGAGNTLAAKTWLLVKLAELCPLNLERVDGLLAEMQENSSIVVSGPWVARLQDWQNETTVWERFREVAA